MLGSGMLVTQHRMTATEGTSFATLSLTDRLPVIGPAALGPWCAFLSCVNSWEFWLKQEP